jgi:hypothetical protein
LILCQTKYESKKEEFVSFHRMIRKMAYPEFRIIDFNDSKYKQFTDDYTNYIDNGHLSERGQKIINSALYKELSLMSHKIR